MSERSLSFISVFPEQTHELAVALSGRLAAGDVICLEGGIGAGKTELARALIRAILLVPEDIPSPTFTLVQTYDTHLGEVWHADLYRLTDVSEIYELGLISAFEEAICLIEWPDRLGAARPVHALTIDLSDGDTDTARRIKLTWQDGRWDKKLAGLKDD